MQYHQKTDEKLCPKRENISKRGFPRCYVTAIRTKMSENILKPNHIGFSQCLHLLTYSRQQAQVPPPIFARLLELLPLPPTRLKFTQDGKQVQQIILQTICLHLLTGATRSMTEKFLPYLYSSAFRTFTSKPKFRLQSPSCKVKQNRQRST